MVMKVLPVISAITILIMKRFKMDFGIVKMKTAAKIFIENVSKNVMVNAETT